MNNKYTCITCMIDLNILKYIFSNNIHTSRVPSSEFIVVREGSVPLWSCRLHQAAELYFWMAAHLHNTADNIWSQQWTKAAMWRMGESWISLCPLTRTFSDMLDGQSQSVYRRQWRHSIPFSCSAGIAETQLLSISSPLQSLFPHATGWFLCAIHTTLHAEHGAREWRVGWLECPPTHFR